MRLLPSRFRRSATLGRRSAVTSMLLAFAVVVVLVTIFILTALDRIADYANRLDDERSRETTSGAIQTFQEQLHATLNDYAAWDDAAQFVYAGDDAWVVGNYGDMTANSDLFDVALIMDTDRNVLMAYQDGAPVTWSPQNYFDTSLWTLFDKASSAGAETVPEAVGFVETKNGIAAVGVALIRQKSGELAQPVEGRRFLIFGRHLDERKILKLSETYVIGGFDLPVPAIRFPTWWKSAIFTARRCSGSSGIRACPAMPPICRSGRSSIARWRWSACFSSSSSSAAAIRSTASRRTRRRHDIWP
ncbi:hypothetical protein LZK73_19155 [Neorhizobium galegae]|nr:hypothetical protein LZK73_19155 [Neorhizobium galegae]